MAWWWNHTLVRRHELKWSSNGTQSEFLRSSPALASQPVFVERNQQHLCSYYNPQPFRCALSWTQRFPIWPWVAAGSVWDRPEMGSYLGLISRTITRLRWLLSIRRDSKHSWPLSLPPPVWNLSLSSSQFPPAIHPRSQPVAFAPLYLFLTVGQVCTDAFHTMIPIYTEECS